MTSSIGIPVCTNVVIPAHKFMSNAGTYQPKTRGEWDICYKYPYPYNALCNFCPSSFELDGVRANSMEGLLQSFKVKDCALQEKVCKLPGFLAKKFGNHLKRTGEFDREHLFWQGKSYDRNSDEYQALLNRAYCAKYSQDSAFRGVLNSTRGYKLSHKIGKTDPKDTVLTEAEFINNLNRLREGSIKASAPALVLSKIQKAIHPFYSPNSVAAGLKDVKATPLNDKFILGESLFSDEREHYINKKYGISNIIDINATEESAKQRAKLCAERGIGYVNAVEDFDFPYDTISSVREFYNGKGYTYINADEKKDANFALSINYIFNDETALTDALLIGTPKKVFYRKLKSMCQKIASDDNCPIRLPKNFGEGFNRKINDMEKLNT